MAEGGEVLYDVKKIFENGTWDPQISIDWASRKPTQKSLRRIKKDVLNTKPPSGCYVEPDEKNFTLVHAIVTGPSGTPYEGGFFYFMVQFPPDYPAQSPRVKIMTTAGNTVRFNPNLYKEGFVCHSLFGTWPGPSWTPTQCLFTILEAFQGIMNKEPYYNEPDLHKFGIVDGRSERYNDFLYHETLRVAVCEMIERPNTTLPASLRSEIKELFLQKFDFYMKRIEEKKYLNGQIMMVDTYGKENGRFNFKKVKKRLLAIHSNLSKADTEESNAKCED